MCLTGEVPPPEIGDLLKICGGNIDIRSGGVFAHLLGVTRAGDHDADRGMSDTKGDCRLAEIFYRPVNQEMKLVCLGQFPDL